MHRDLVLIVLVTLLSIAGYTDGKVCPSVDVRNRPEDFEKLRNCTIIMGNFFFVLINVEESVFDEYSFPELTEVVDYMIVFSVTQLDNLGKLFPNLKIIRGRKLFLDRWGLTIFNMPKLKEIGLTNLEYIGGAVKIDRCPSLCYLTTINWEVLGVLKYELPKYELQTCINKHCPAECSNCWNNNTCQKPISNFCHNFTDNGKCVSQCPPSKVVNYDIMQCLTKQECESMPNGTWWVANGTCIKSCPVYYVRDERIEGGCRYARNTYTKHCSGELVNTRKKLEEMKYCSHIDGFLEIQISDIELEVDLEEYFENIVSISQYLKVGRTKTLTSFDFLKNLTTIKGEKLYNNNVLFVYENENLRRLWNFTDDFRLDIPIGNISFHDNPQLCLSEIKKLESVKGVKSKVDLEIAKLSNGYKSVCKQKFMNVTILENNPTNVTIAWERLSNQVVLGYTFYYQPKEQEIEKNDDTCSVDSWDGIFVRENRLQLTELTAFTAYTYYIKTYINDRQEEQTPTSEFITASTEPSEPRDLKVENITSSSLVLKWKPPLHSNGILTQYIIFMYYEEDYLETIQQRNYCKNPHVPQVKQEHFIKKFLTNSTRICNCTEETIQISCDLNSSNELEKCIKTAYHDNSYFFNKTNDIIKSNPETELDLLEMNDNYFMVPANETMYEFRDLQHFSLYTFYLMACNRNERDFIQCGASEVLSQRTKKKKSADLIRGLTVRIYGNKAHIEWLEPVESNSALVSYQIEYKRTDSGQSKSRFECITEDKYQNYDRVKILELSSGSYAVRVQAISLAGPGIFSQWNYFEIRTENSSLILIFGPMVAVIIFGVMVIIGYWWYRKKKLLENNHLITSINPDYAGPIYHEDEWEMDRNDIDIIRALGHGSFGMVYQGFIKSKQLPCAVKTVNESASMPSRMEFLNEGSVMKTFNDGQHVVRLLGIVSRGQPPLVIMELMERGDLKTYLRRCREPSQNLTTNELYRMAAEIADGMAYLAAKKFVHRDLAARNCMVAADRTVKIGDFGMARDIYETDYYRKETVGLLPVRWMAPESLADGVFTTDSDVWSYGIVLWEMATLAEQPYQGYSNEEVFHFVKNKGRLERPAECSDLLYEVMDACWMWRPNDRPTFADIVDKLVDHVGQDFRLVAFCYSRQGRELALNAGPRVYNPPAMLPVPEDDYFSHYDPTEEEVNLYVKDSNRPTKFLPFSNQRMNKSSPYQISPGSPSSTFSLNSS